jgi:putative tryptophan/tyrosine transport system substrate-binding protein
MEQNILPENKRKKFFTYVIVIAVTVLVLGAVVSFFTWKNKPAPKVYHVGILSGLSYFSDVPDGFKGKMAELGYIEGKNISYYLHEMDFDTDGFKSVIGKFINDKVDLIFVFPTEPALEAKMLTQETKIPVVFVAANIEDVNLVKSVREPGGNMTGVRWTGSDVALLRFETMHEIVPQAKRFFIPYQAGVPIVDSQIKVIRAAAEKYGITIKEIPAVNPPELEKNLNAIALSDKDAILLILEPLAASTDGFTVLDKFATEHKIPLGGTYISSTNYQTLFGINPSNVEMGKQAATLADKILQGISAGTLPVSSAELRLTINYKVIQKMGLKINEGLLNRAYEIIR